MADDLCRCGTQDATWCPQCARPIVAPRSDGEREREIRERSPRLSVADAGKHYHADVEFLLFLVDDLREQLGRAQRDSERLDWMERTGAAVSSYCHADEYGWYAAPRSEYGAQAIGDTVREAIDAAKSAAVARETGE